MSSLIISVSVLLAVVALLRAHLVAKRLHRLSEFYWELRYESGQLKGRVTRLEVAAGLRDAEPEPAAPQAESPATFIPLSSLKK